MRSARSLLHATLVCTVSVALGMYTADVAAVAVLCRLAENRLIEGNETHAHIRTHARTGTGVSITLTQHSKLAVAGLLVV